MKENKQSNQSILGEIGSVRLETRNTVTIDPYSVGLSAGILAVCSILVIVIYKLL